jgi:hypothetical protein
MRERVSAVVALCSQGLLLRRAEAEDTWNAMPAVHSIRDDRLIERGLASSEALGTSHEAHVRATGATSCPGTFMEMRGKSPAPYLQTKVGAADEEGPAT